MLNCKSAAILDNHSCGYVNHDCSEKCPCDFGSGGYKFMEKSKIDGSYTGKVVKGTSLQSAEMNKEFGTFDSAQITRDFSAGVLDDAIRRMTFPRVLVAHVYGCDPGVCTVGTHGEHCTGYEKPSFNFKPKNELLQFKNDMVKNSEKTWDELVSIALAHFRMHYSNASGYSIGSIYKPCGRHDANTAVDERCSPAKECNPMAKRVRSAFASAELQRMQGESWDNVLSRTAHCDTEKLEFIGNNPLLVCGGAMSKANTPSTVGDIESELENQIRLKSGTIAVNGAITSTHAHYLKALTDVQAQYPDTHNIVAVILGPSGSNPSISIVKNDNTADYYNFGSPVKPVGELDELPPGAATPAGAHKKINIQLSVAANTNGFIDYLVKKAEETDKVPNLPSPKPHSLGSLEGNPFGKRFKGNTSSPFARRESISQERISPPVGTLFSDATKDRLRGTPPGRLDWRGAQAAAAQRFAQRPTSPTTKRRRSPVSSEGLGEGLPTAAEQKYENEQRLQRLQHAAMPAPTPALLRRGPPNPNQRRMGSVFDTTPASPAPPAPPAPPVGPGGTISMGGQRRRSRSRGARRSSRHTPSQLKRGRKSKKGGARRRRNTRVKARSRSKYRKVKTRR